MSKSIRERTNGLVAHECPKEEIIREKPISLYRI
jgi:hypothetical protein